MDVKSFVVIMIDLANLWRYTEEEMLFINSWK